VKNKCKGKTLRQLGRRLEENVLGTFVYVFFVLAIQIRYGVVPYVTDKGVGVGGTPAEEFNGVLKLYELHFYPSLFLLQSS
jgi:hypothetical protein